MNPRPTALVVTLTPNPSLDRTYELAGWSRGEVNRATGVHVDAGGKGINVSRALLCGTAGTHRPARTAAVFPAGGPDGARIVATLADLGVPAVPVPVPGETRSNVTLADADGATTKINAPGPVLDEDATAALLAAVATALDASAREPEGSEAGESVVDAVVVGAGSLPDGAPTDLYVRLGEVVAARGATLVVDTSGAPLEAVAAAGCAALLKPNDDELAELVGAPLETVGDVVDAARTLVARGTAEVLVSLGAHGALLVTADRTWWAGGAPLVPASTVGAGDTTLAGYLAVRRPGATHPADADPAGADPADADPGEALATAVAWGRAAVLLPGTTVPTPDLIHRDDVTLVAQPDRTLALKEL